MLEDLLSELPEELGHRLRYHGLLVPLLEKELIRRELAGVTLSSEKVDESWSTALEHAGLTDPVKLQRHLLEAGLSEADLREKAEFPARLSEHLSNNYLHQAEARFLSRKHELDRVVYSLLRLDDPFLSRELYLRIKEGEANFADLAFEHSQGPERNTKGIVGPVPMNQAHPQLVEKLRTSSPGQLLEPLQIERWWLIIRLESYVPASLDQATAQLMAKELFEQHIQQAVLEIIQGSQTVALQQVKQ
jgi:parvulin-like peptidyl-prolyl isomerase